MVNKLRLFSLGSSTLLISLTVWATLEYGKQTRSQMSLLLAGTLAILVAVLPPGLAYLKSWMAKSLDRLRGRRSPARSNYTFVSESPTPRPNDALRAISEALEANEEYDGVRRESFPEGEGLVVTHSGFHNSFIRVLDDDRLVLAGASQQTRSLTDLVEQATSLSFTMSCSNPFTTSSPIRGGMRVVLTVALVAMLIFGVVSVGQAGYASNAYNPAERTVLVSLDLRGDIIPGVSEANTRLAKAAFLVEVLEETAVEISWERTDKRARMRADRASRIAADVRAELATLDDESLTPAQVNRVQTIRAELTTAEQRVDAALTQRLSEDNSVSRPRASNPLLTRNRTESPLNRTEQENNYEVLSR